MPLKKLVVTVGVLAVLGGSGAASWFLYFKPVEVVKDRVRSVLKDPDSAKFENVKYFKKTDVGCGFVNARNSMGGYIGKRIFVAFPDGDVRFHPTDLDAAARINFIVLVEANCPDAE